MCAPPGVEPLPIYAVQCRAPFRRRKVVIVSSNLLRNERARIQPFVLLHMAIGKGQAACLIVVGGWDGVNPSEWRDKLKSPDPPGMSIHKGKVPRRRRIDNLRYIVGRASFPLVGKSKHTIQGVAS